MMRRQTYREGLRFVIVARPRLFSYPFCDTWIQKTSDTLIEINFLDRLYFNLKLQVFGKQ